MPSPRLSCIVLLVFVLLSLSLAACGGSSTSGTSGAKVPGESSEGVSIKAEFSPTPNPILLDAPPTPTSTPALAPSPIPVAPSPTAVRATATPLPPVPAATQAPAAAAPAPAPAPQTAPASASLVTFKPETLVQGGWAVVYLNAEASNATLSFGGKQFAMARDGARWWAIVGIGALTSAGEAPANVSYTTPAGGTASAATRIPIAARQFPVESITLSPSAAALLAPDIIYAELNQRAAIYGQYSAQRLWSGPFVRPSAAALSDEYGIGRSYNGAPVTDYHKGVDFAGLTGSPVVASAAGRVVFAGELKVRGGSVIIDHGMGVYSAYHHFSQINVAQGQMVAPGQNIGAVGETGLVTGPHLHWEVIVRGVEVDGLLWLRGTEIGP